MALNRGNRVAIVDLRAGSFRTILEGIAPYAVAVDEGRVFVSCWGRPPGAGKAHAPSAGKEVEDDERGVPTGGTPRELDAQGGKVREWRVGG